jgi:hypothetical protein
MTLVIIKQGDPSIIVAQGADLIGSLTLQATSAAAASSASAVNSGLSADIALAASLTAPNVYATIAAGLAAVANGQTFWSNESGSPVLYRDVAGVATALDMLGNVRNFASTAALAAYPFAHPKTATVGGVIWTTSAVSEAGNPFALGSTSSPGSWWVPAPLRYTSLATIKAAPLSAGRVYTLTASGLEGDFRFETGDFTSRNDDIDIIKLDAVALTVGALVRDNGRVYNDRGTGAVTRSVARIMRESPVNFMDYYIPSDGINYSPTFNRWFARIMETGRSGYVPPAPNGATYYTMLSAINMDIFLRKNVGFHILGAGIKNTAFDFRGISNPVNIFCSGGTVGSPISCIHPKIEDMTFIGDQPGPVVRVGLANYADQVNELIINDVNIQNFNTGSSSAGMEMNACFNPCVRAVINCGSGGYVGGNGYALILKQVAFGSIHGSIGSANISLYLTGSFNYGNVITAPDFENVSYCVVQDSANSVRNTIIGGQFSYSSSGVHSIAGGRLLLINPNPNPSGVGTLGGFVGTPTGILIQGQGFTPGNLPVLAASGVSMLNSTGMDLEMILRGGTVTQLNRNGAGAYPWLTNSSTRWRANTTMALTYSTTPSFELYPY